MVTMAMSLISQDTLIPKIGLLSWAEPDKEDEEDWALEEEEEDDAMTERENGVNLF